MKTGWLTLIVLVGLSFGLIVSPLQAGPPLQEDAEVVSNITFTNYGKFEGLLANDIRGFVQDEKGYLYLATNEGLWKYNGSQFYPVLTTREGLASNNIITLFQDSHGDLWAGTGKGLQRISNDQAEETFSEGVAIWASATEDVEGNIWYTDLDSAVLMKVTGDDGSQTYGEKEGLIGPYVPLNDSQNRLWVGTDEGLIHFENNEIAQQITAGLQNQDIHRVFEDHAGAIWVTDIDGRLSRITDGQAETMLEPLIGYIDAVLVDQDGTIWFGSSNGLIRYRSGETPQHFTTEHGLVDNYVLSLFEDRDGNIWIGTPSGVSKITKNPPMQPFIGPKVYAQMVDHNGVIWLGSATGLYQLANDQLTQVYTVDDGLGSDNIKAIVEDDQQRVWIGTTDGLTVIEQGEIKKTYTTEDGLPPGTIWSLLHDSQGKIWVGTDSGIALIQGDAVSKILSGVADPTVTARVEALGEGKNGHVFAGVRGYGLTLLDSDGTFIRQYTEEDGFVGSRVRGLDTDFEGNAWVPAADGIVHHIVDEEIQATYTASEEAILDIPRTALIGPDGTAWIGLDSFGLSSIVSDSFLKNYSYADGLISSSIYSLDKDQDGNILIGTGTGLVRFEATPFSLDLQLDTVTLPQIDERGQAYEIPLAPGENGVYRMDYNQQIIRFRYASLDYRVDAKRFQTKLEGYDEYWQDMGPRTERTYMNLPAGSYTFRVRVQNFDGTWNPAEIAVPLTIRPPWWETAGFQALVLAVVAMILFAGFRWRIHAIERQNQLLEEQVAERTKELTEKSSALAQSNQALARSNEELKIARQKAEVANEAKSTFLANMSHELRSPLNAILGFAQVMNRSPELNKENREHLNIISRSGDHLLTLINQVLDLSKIEAGRTTLHETDFDLYRLLIDVEDMFSLKAEAKDITLIVTKTADLPQYIRTDEIKLRQVLINLLSNALKFTEEGQVSVTVESTSLADNHCQIKVAVADTGPGVDPDEYDKLFTAFVQTSTGEKAQEGTGLGLPISRRFVQLMGGDIQVASVVDGPETGTTFTFTIEAQHAQMANTTIEAEQAVYRQVIGLVPDQPQYRILIVDDRWTNRELLYKLLEPLGFELRTASNGQEAITVWEEWSPHLIWMDMRMPVMDGYAATEHIKSQVKGQATAIIALTASVLEEERSIVLSAGCDALLRKPFREREIFEVMAEHIGVQYIYQTPEEVTSNQVNEAFETQIKSQLQKLPITLQNNLVKAANENDLSTMNELIEIINQHDAHLGEALKALADDFEYETIAQLVDDGENNE